MSQHRSATRANATAGLWVIDTRDLGRRPGTSRRYHRTAEVPVELGVPEVISVPAGGEVELDVLLESVVEGVLASGTAETQAAGQCARCLEPMTETVRVEFTELFAYPDSATEATTDADEVYRLVDDRLNLEPVARDAIVFALPVAPLCTPNCAGLCPECGGRWAELGPDHEHETIDPRWAVLKDRFGEASD
ncbi:MAG TPA: YceD family protein [Pseudonocardiaceae bacterium]|jgi:uncharacterized protein|nr:YceD family protein [Pseudonocardiaceae bacterium]